MVKKNECTLDFDLHTYGESSGGKVRDHIPREGKGHDNDRVCVVCDDKTESTQISALIIVDVSF